MFTVHLLDYCILLYMNCTFILSCNLKWNFCRDGKNRELIRVEENPLILKTKITPKKLSASSTTSDTSKATGLLHSAVLEVGKRVRHSFRTSQNLLEERPGAKKCSVN